jgi:hypothetical protein
MLIRDSYLESSVCTKYETTIQASPVTDIIILPRTVPLPLLRVCILSWFSYSYLIVWFLVCFLSVSFILCALNSRSDDLHIPGPFLWHLYSTNTMHSYSSSVTTACIVLWSTAVQASKMHSRSYIHTVRHCSRCPNHNRRLRLSVVLGHWKLRHLGC